MSDIDDIPEMDQDPASEFEIEQSSSKPVGNSVKGVGLRTVLVSSAVAAALGISGGTYFGGMAAKHPDTEFTSIRGDMDSRLASVKKEVGTLTAKLDRLERQVGQKTSTSTPTFTSAPDGKTSDKVIAANPELDARLTSVEAALETFEAKFETNAGLESGETETASLPDFTEYTARLDILEKAAFEPKSLDALADFRDRIALLEAQIKDTKITLDKAEETPEALAATAVQSEELEQIQSDFEQRLAALETAELPEIPSVDLAPLSARIDALEDRLDTIPVVLPPFPRQAVMEAIEQSKSKDEKGSWLSRTIGQQVVVQDADILARLDRIESSVELRDIAAIKKDVASLPDSAQTALEAWLIEIDKTGNVQ